MEKLRSEEGFRSTFEFYASEEQKFRKLAEEAYQHKIRTLQEWKEFNNGGKE